MPQLLSATEVMQSLLVLGLAVRTDLTFSYFGGDAVKLRDAEVCKKALEQVDAAQAAKVREILTQYAPVEYDTDTVKAEGLDSNPARLRKLCKCKLADTIGYVPKGGLGGLKTSRG